ncbi:hypothetical protein BARVI_03095 [Barnesiella viscericola DSM 18177]|uniref:Uncharacterized protein n=1 Tax=Barnesiella viscericola DSM 18177 TaxID=880074 RepID=W0EX46_9BACT|nr:hypothetical protein [Barnesiella viscericola]AHF13636.1 hypothetical protein BARVI_03095 [Barnesiella viscericola DSM 18177]
MAYGVKIISGDDRCKCQSRFFLGRLPGRSLLYIKGVVQTAEAEVSRPEMVTRHFVAYKDKFIYRLLCSIPFLFGEEAVVKYSVFWGELQKI